MRACLPLDPAKHCWLRQRGYCTPQEKSDQHIPLHYQLILTRLCMCLCAVPVPLTEPEVMALLGYMKQAVDGAPEGADQYPWLSNLSIAMWCLCQHEAHR